MMSINTISSGEYYENLDALINQIFIGDSNLQVNFETQYTEGSSATFNIVVNSETVAAVVLNYLEKGFVVVSFKPYDPIAGVKEVCEIMGWEYPQNKSMVDTYVKRGILPPPIQRLGSGPVWIADTVRKIKDLRSQKRKSRLNKKED